MAPVVTRTLPLVLSLDLVEIVGTGSPADSPGVPAAIGSRFIRTDGASGTTEYRKFGAGATEWENALGGGGGGGGGPGSGVASVTGSNGIAASPTSGAVVVSPTYGAGANTVAQGNDARFLTTGDKTDLTDGGDTTLHTHDSRYYTEAEVDALLASLGSGFAPTYIGPTETFTVPANRQAPYALPIVNDGLIVIGPNAYLVLVD